MIENIDLQKAIRELNEFEQQIIRMRFYEDMKLINISLQLNIPYTTAFETLERIIAKIRTIML